MNINEVINPKIEKIGQFELYLDGNSKFKFIHINFEKDITNNGSGRVYYIVVDDEIYKIGASKDKKGIKGTIGGYCNYSCGGQPSDRTVGIAVLIYKELMLGKKVSAYAIPIIEIDGPIEGLYGTTIGKISDAFATENKCISQYVERQKRYPIWNIQEQNITSPEIKEITKKIRSKYFSNRKELTDHINEIDVKWVKNNKCKDDTI